MEHIREPWEPKFHRERDIVQIKKPRGLKGHASKHWDEVIPLILQTVEVLPVDLPALMSLCQWWHEYQTLLAAESADASAAYKRSIALASCFKNWSQLASKFGLSPKDREKLTVRDQPEQEAALEFIR